MASISNYLAPIPVSHTIDENQETASTQFASNTSTIETPKSASPSATNQLLQSFHQQLEQSLAKLPKDASTQEVLENGYQTLQLLDFILFGQEPRTETAKKTPRRDTV